MNIPVENFSFIISLKHFKKTFTKKTLTMTASTRRKTLEKQKNVDRDAETIREGASMIEGHLRLTSRAKKKVQRRKSRRVAGKPPEFAGL